MNQRRALSWSLVGITAVATGLAFGPSATAAGPGRAGDYNGDTIRDLAIGAPIATVAGIEDAGAVGVVRGSLSGVDITKYQRIEQSRGWVPGNAGDNKRFGMTLASGDLNGDGYSDLVACSAGDFNDATPNARVFFFNLGSANGLTKSFIATPDSAETCGGMASGDFNKDGFADIFFGGKNHYVAYGGAGVTSPAGVTFHPIGTPVTDPQQPDPAASGDVNGDGYADLVSVYDVAGSPRLGLYLGSASGLPAMPSQSIRTPLLRSLAVGDVDGDRKAEVAGGNPQAKVGSIESAGLVLVWRGSATGIDTTRAAQVITQNSPGVPDIAEKYDGFGDALAFGDANGDRLADLAISAYNEAIGTVDYAGLVTLVPGKTTGLDLASAKTFSQDTAGVPDAAEEGDSFGGVLLFRDLNADGRQDLAISSPGENDIQGVVHVLNGSRTGITGTGAKLLTPSQFGISRTLAFFGVALG